MKIQRFSFDSVKKMVEEMGEEYKQIFLISVKKIKNHQEKSRLIGNVFVNLTKINEHNKKADNDYSKINLSKIIDNIDSFLPALTSNRFHSNIWLFYVTFQDSITLDQLLKMKNRYNNENSLNYLGLYTVWYRIVAYDHKQKYPINIKYQANPMLIAEKYNRFLEIMEFLSSKEYLSVGVRYGIANMYLNIDKLTIDHLDNILSTTPHEFTEIMLRRHGFLVLTPNSYSELIDRITLLLSDSSKTHDFLEKFYELTMMSDKIHPLLNDYLRGGSYLLELKKLLIMYLTTKKIDEILLHIFQNAREPVDLNKIAEGIRIMKTKGYHDNDIINNQYIYQGNLDVIKHLPNSSKR